MDRLTEPTIGCFKYDLKDHKHEVGEFNTYDAFFDYNMAVMRLGKYENLGTPDEITAMQAEFDSYKTLGTPTEFSNALWKVEQFEADEAAGTLIRLPCKVGDTVWTIQSGKILKQKVWRVTNEVSSSVGFNNVSVGTQATAQCPYAGGFSFAFSDFGKTVFLTREEAEAALNKEAP